MYSEFRFNIFLTLFIAFGAIQMYGQESNHTGVHVIVLDAGHGGKDPGAIYRGVREKDITLEITQKLGRMLERRLGDVKVIYTRKDDRFITLHGRAEIANRNKADIFVSIHCNYFKKNKHKHGSETFVMGLHKIEDNLLVAKRENAVVSYERDAGAHYDFDVNTPEGHIFLSMYQNASLDRSIRIADDIEQSFVSKLKTSCRGVKQAGFYVLYKTSMPSVLVETGFLTNDQDRALLTSETGQERIAEAIFEAIVKYKASTEGKEVADIVHVDNKIHPRHSQSSKQVPSSSRKSRKDDRYYVVQIAATTKRRPDLLRTVKHCSETHQGKFYKYKVGRFTTFEAAGACREEMLKRGFDGAFIIAQ